MKKKKVYEFEMDEFVWGDDFPKFYVYEEEDDSYIDVVKENYSQLEKKLGCNETFLRMLQTFGEVSLCDVFRSMRKDMIDLNKKIEELEERLGR